MHFPFMTSNASWIFESHFADVTFEILSRPMNRSMNVEHVFGSESCATDLTGKWSVMFWNHKDRKQSVDVGGENRFSLINENIHRTH